LFLGENNIKDLQGVSTPVKDGDKLVLIPSIAGGASRHSEEPIALSGVTTKSKRGDEAISSRVGG
jgi:hypothetical protein